MQGTVYVREPGLEALGTPPSCPEQEGAARPRELHTECIEDTLLWPPNLVQGQEDLLDAVRKASLTQASHIRFGD